ncbi:MAG: XdhC family protein [Rhodospirillales bacterium]|nr:XdhC family protein [Rhodospirillales bacterium]
MNRNDEVLEQAAEWLDQGQKVALATVIGTWGSSPRPVGSQLAISGKGAFVGSVSGGCVEGAVVDAAAEVLAAGPAPRVVEFGVTDEKAWSVGLSCGGTIRVLVGAAPPVATLRALSEIRPAALATHLGSGRQVFLHDSAASGDEALASIIAKEAKRAIAADQSALIETTDGPVFIHVFGRPWRIVVIGAVHVAQAFAPMAVAAGFEVAVVDPRGAFATPERFPGVRLMPTWPEEALARHGLDSRTAIVTLTHDPKIDDEALQQALRSECFYVGSLGSRKTHAKRLDRLRALGISDATLRRIHAPVGLDIGARSAAEIGVSILAEIVAAKHGRDPRAPTGATVAAAAKS